MPRSPVTDSAPERLDAESRREALLDVARALVEEGGPDNVSMGSVADRAEVTRALVYKHFANRADILAALYRREAAALDRSFRQQVTAAPDGFEPKLRAFVHAAGEAANARGQFFAPLRAYGQDSGYRQEKSSWDRRTLKFFSVLAVEEYGLDPAVAQTAVAVLLSGVVSHLTQASGRRRASDRAALEDLLVRMAVVSLSGLGEALPAR